jgi:tetratricopeptide (TPR) repeat protein
MMSYINDALRKAQRDRDCRYERFGGIIISCPDGQVQPRKRKFVLGAAVTLIVLVPAALLLAVYALNQPPPAGKGTSPPAQVAAEKPAATQTAIPPAVRSGAEPVAPQVEKTVFLAERAPASREAEALYQEALAVQRKGDLNGAEALYRKVLLLAPGHVRAMNNLGVLYLGQKKRDRAISMFSRAIVLRKDYVDPYYNMACLYAQANEIDESLWYLKVAVAINGDVKKWVDKDADMKNVAESPAFKKIMEGQKN